MLSRIACASLLVASAALPGCQSGGEPALDRDQRSIKGGMVDLLFPATCAMDIILPPDEDGMPQDPILCSCSLVEAQTVLTAASCVHQNLEADALADITVYFGNTIDTAETTHAITSVEPHR